MKPLIFFACLFACLVLSLRSCQGDEPTDPPPVGFIDGHVKPERMVPAGWVRI